MTNFYLIILNSIILEKNSNKNFFKFFSYSIHAEISTARMAEEGEEIWKYEGGIKASC